MRGSPPWKASPRLRPRALGLNTLQMRTAFPITRGLVSYWPFQLGGAVDEYGRNNGTVSGATKTIGKYGDALATVATSDRVTVPDDPSLRITGNITIEAWVYYVSGTYYFIAAKDTHLKEFYFYVYPAGSKVRWYRSGSGTDVAFTTPTSEWFHIAVVDNGANALFFKNGLQVASGASQTGTSGTDDVNIANAVGENYAGNGKIDEVCIYNRALSDDEIRENMYRHKYC